MHQNYHYLLPLYKKAARAGNSYAQNNLAVCYERGEYVSVDLKKAVRLYATAAKAGNPHAMYNLARCYDKGIGVEKDKEKAKQFYVMAATMMNKDKNK